MRNSPKVHVESITNKGFEARYAPVAAMVKKIVEEIEPELYGELLEDLIKTWKPFDHEVRVLQHLAWVSTQMRGCNYLETQYLREKMQVYMDKGMSGQEAYQRAFIEDLSGPNFTGKIGRYESRLQTEQSRCIRLIEAQTKRRKLAREAAAAKLARSKPCTNVIQ